MRNRSKALLNVLAAIVLAGVVMSEGFGDDAGDTAKDLRDDCEQESALFIC